MVTHHPQPTPALARLRAAVPAPPAMPVRVLRHRGSCGDAAGAAAIVLDVGAPVVDVTCDGACWAAPAATVVRAGHRHRFVRLDRGVRDELAACVRGECDEPQAGSGVAGITARLGRNDGTLADVLSQGGYAAYALAATLAPARILEVARVAGRDMPLVATLLVNACDAPGVVVARHFLEGDPHRVVEGILIAARATGVRAVRVSIDEQSTGARDAFARALADACDAGILDGSALGGDAITIDVQGDVRAGDEDGEGLDVETLCALTTIFDTPPPPTRLVSLSGDLARGGLYEVPLDGNTTWAGVLATAGVMPARVQALLLGGVSGRLVLPRDFDAALDAHTLGDGGVQVLGPDADLEGLGAR